MNSFILCNRLHFSSIFEVLTALLSYNDIGMKAVFVFFYYRLCVSAI